MTNQAAIDRFWQTYLATLPPGQEPPPHPEAWSFGDHPALADQLAELVLAGVKTATCSALWAYEAEGEPLPQPGQHSIILSGAGQPLAVAETVEVQIKRFDQVDAAFAYAEGEDDRSLASWREGHRRFFTRTLPAIGREFDETMPLVCERFRVLYRRPAEPDAEPGLS
jgi:uncharacterized protein YhfF